MRNLEKTTFTVILGEKMMHQKYSSYKKLTLDFWVANSYVKPAAGYTAVTSTGPKVLMYLTILFDLKVKLLYYK